MQNKQTVEGAPLASGLTRTLKLPENRRGMANCLKQDFSLGRPQASYA